MATRKIEAHNRGYVLLSLLVLLDSLSPSLSLSPSGFIQRESKLQILASLPPATSGSTQQFLASPSGKFAAYFVRSRKSGGFGSDFCYIDVQGGGGQSFSDAGCTEIGGADTCTLVFSDSGLEIYDGNRSGWNSGGSSDHLDTLILLDSGELMMKNKEGESSLKVTDNSKEAPHCRTTGQSTLTPPTSGNTPSGKFFIDPDDGESEQGQQQGEEGEEGEEGQSNQQQGIFPGFNQPFSSQNQPFSSQNQPFSSQNQPFSSQNQPFSSQNPLFGNGNGQPFQNNNPFENGVSVKKANSPLLVAMSLISLMAALTVLFY